MAISLPIVSTFDKRGISKATGALSGFSRTIQNVSAASVAALGGISVAAVKMAGQFETSFSRIEGLVGVQGEQLAELEEAALRLGPQFGKSAQEAADALFFITSAGLRGESAIETLEASLRGAAIGLGETKTIADLATSAVNAYGESNLGATEAVDLLAEAVRLGKLEPAELAGAMGSLLPIASEMGVTFDQVGAAMAGMSKTGTDASMASTQLRQILFSIKKPTAQAEEQLERMGLSAQGLRDQIRSEGLLSTLQTLVNSFGDNEEASAKVFGNVRALSGVLDLMGGNAEDNADIFALMADDIAITGEAMEATSDTFEFRFSQAVETAKAALIPFGDALAEIAGEGLEKLMPSIEAFGTTMEHAGTKIRIMRNSLDDAAGIAATALAPFQPLIDAFAKLGPVLGGLTPVFTVLGDTIQALGADYFESLAEIIAELVEGPLLTLLGTIVSILPQIVSLAVTFAELLLPVVETLANISIPMLDGILKVIAPVIQFVAKVVDGTGSSLMILTAVVFGVIKAVAAYRAALVILQAAQFGAALAAAGVTTGLKGYGIAARIANIVTGLLNGSLIKNTALMIGGKVASIAHAVATRSMAAATTLASFAMNKLKLGLIATKVATVAQTIATKAAAVAQRALNLAMNMSPLGKIIALVSLIAAGLIYFFTQTEIGKQIWTTFTTVVMDTITAVADWFTEIFTVVIPELWTTFTTFLAETWQGFSEGFMSVLEGIGEFFKDMINGYIGIWEGFINFFIRGINTIIDGLNKLNFDAPDWVRETFGVSSFGVSISRVPEVSLPRLAEGGIVTGPTVALIGEAGPEAVVPLSGKNRPGGSTYNITVQAGVGDPVRIGEEVVNIIRRYERSSGKVFASA